MNISRKMLFLKTKYFSTTKDSVTNFDIGIENNWRRIIKQLFVFYDVNITFVIYYLGSRNNVSYKLES